MDELAPIAATVAVDRRAPVKSSRSTLATMADLEPYLAALFGREADPDVPRLRPRRDRHDAARRRGARSPSRIDGRARARHVRGARRRRRAVPRAAREPREGRLPAARRRRRGARDRRGAPERGDRRRACASRSWSIASRVSPRERAAPAGGDRGGVVAGRRPRRAPGRAARRERQAATAPRDGRAAASCARSARAPSSRRGPGLFSYNSPFGACDACRGFGRIIAIDWDKVIPDPNKTLEAGAIKPWSGPSTSGSAASSRSSARSEEIPLDVPWEQARPTRSARLVIDGEGTWHGGKYPGRPRLVRVARDAHLQDARARPPLALPRVRASARRAAARASTRRRSRTASPGSNLGEWHALTVGDALARIARRTRRATRRASACRSSSRRASGTSTRSASATSRSTARRARSRAARRSARG